MIYLDVSIDHLCSCGDTIGCVHPNVRITVDVGDNVNLEMMNDFKNRLERYIDKGLNECLTSR